MGEEEGQKVIRRIADKLVKHQLLIVSAPPTACTWQFDRGLRGQPPASLLYAYPGTRRNIPPPFDLDPNSKARYALR